MSGLSKFINNKYLSDVSIKIEDTSYKAHKVILASSSEYFFRLFENEAKSDVKFPAYTEPKFGNVPIKSLFEQVLAYIYSDQDTEVILENLNEETANCLMAISYAIAIPSLLELSVEFIIDHMLCAKNCVDYLLEGIKFHSQTLIDASTNQIIHNFQDILKDPNFIPSLLSLPFKHILKVISSDELKVDNEKSVFDVVSLVVSAEKKFKDEEILELFGKIRWPFLSHGELLAAASNPKMSVFKDMILEGVSVQLSEHSKPQDYEYKVIRTPRTSYLKRNPSKKLQTVEAPIRFVSKTQTQNNWKSFPKVIEKQPHPPQTFSRSFMKPGREFTYTYDLDENGLFFYLGTCGKLKDWENPAESGRVLAFSSSVGSGVVEDLVGRALSDFRTKNEVNSFVGVDLGEGRSLRVSAYTLKNGNSSSNTMVGWNFQGSVNGSDWVMLDRRNNRGLEDLRLLREKGKTSTWGVNKSEKSYRFFRLVQADKNITENHILSVSCFELYGTAGGENWDFSDKL